MLRAVARCGEVLYLQSAGIVTFLFAKAFVEVRETGMSLGIVADCLCWSAHRSMVARSIF